jgi:hypothetical protein
MMTKSKRLTLSSILIALLLSAPFAQSRRPGGAITGRVMDESGQPFPYAVVRVSPVNGSQNEERELATDENGFFEARDLVSKAYRVVCYAPGYIEDKTDDASVYHLTGSSIALRLIKGGAITGMVTDASGDPVVKARVVAIRLRDAEGRLTRSAEVYQRAETDDRGVYRIYGLEAGSFLVAATSGGMYEDAHITSQSPTYHPSSVRDGAQTVAVRFGEETAGIDIRLRGERGHAVSGRLSGAMKGDAYVRLIHAESGAVEARAFFDNDSFAFYGVADGQYFVDAFTAIREDRSAASASRRITVRGADVAGIELNLTKLGSIAGRVMIEAAPKNKPPCKDARAAKFEEMVVAVFRDTKTDAKDSPAFLSPDSRAGAADEKGGFSIDSLWPGRYRLKPIPINENLFIRAVTMRAAAGLIDITREGIAVKSGEQIKGVTITLAEGAASLRGRVVPQDEKSKLPARVHVHLLPTEKSDDPLRFFETETQPDGSFALTRIAPGRYLIYVRRDDQRETIRPAAWGAETRAALRRAAESAGATIDLQSCQRVSDYALHYPMKK